MSRFACRVWESFLAWKTDTHTHTHSLLISISLFVSTLLAYLFLIRGQESQSDLISHWGGRELFSAAGIHWEREEKTGRVSHWVLITAHTLHYIMLLVHGRRYASTCACSRLWEVIIKPQGWIILILTVTSQTSSDTERLCGSLFPTKWLLGTVGGKIHVPQKKKKKIQFRRRYSQQHAEVMQSIQRDAGVAASSFTSYLCPHLFPICFTLCLFSDAASSPPRVVWTPRFTLTGNEGTI